ncbi:hypothetical protein DL96DRAFT_1579392 [Flagelloscypha sp. PMI_526]|nr:hypothetical protein DL96DRAFT_1579392 [Flagelloscypha sp. PMI_526]
MSHPQNSTPLPPLSAVKFDANGMSLWIFLLSAEKAASSSEEIAKSLDNLVGSRVLGHFLKDFWDHSHGSLGLAPYYHLCNTISSAIGKMSAPIASEQEAQIQHETLWELGLMYRNCVMRVLRSNTSSFSPSSHSSPLSFETHRKTVLQIIRDVPKSKSDAKAVALVRDGYRCVLSGAIDFTSSCKYEEVVDLPGGAAETNGAHLFSASAHNANEGYTAAVLTVLKLFRLEAELESTLGDNANDPRNILTLDSTVHRFFEQLNMWLEEVADMPNTYDIVVPPSARRIFDKMYHRPPSRVTLRVAEELLQECAEHNITPPALPDPKLIAIRASCARVAHLSGAAAQIDELDREVEQTLFLAEDGSSASFFGSLLRLQSNHVNVGV